ncbi:CPBP family intramembrane metalloprotease [Clostridium sp. CM028]|uniref:CPBP family intramembrane glutamic endopeptidase n=1 Tax=unclassified Clostridium TaxID=2614128 RepID=UPI001C0BC535|nr:MULTISPECIES: type II CAAX endopeptidase family protein [unclassified Clostridium]MBU3093041.1 CPBP family intramembrane metalloprotease [Clostridium sp. CF011]MBW9145021.1 CPBP family intramembrane metalloprotease [Clostridium sp. CM027]MBW9148569.1 CPBP family intramembrane metalloprotease [Clostridium sp. CM028]UVE40152.1 CPBP family intramembrane metalloprotease [Clostridium sp. CM027]WAG69096.1 CPBP family intramembrane metalloprotease [Clostridium sp. CF011]
MDTNLTKIKNEILAFLLATFSITFGMGLIMFFVYKHIDASGVQAFAIVQMLYPALAAIGIRIYYEKNSISKGLMDFFTFYIIFSVLCIIILVVGVFAFPGHVSIVINTLVIIASIFAFTIIMINKDNRFEKISMVFKKNFKTVILLGLLYIVLKLIIVMFGGLVDGNLSEILKKTMMRIALLTIIVPIGVVSSFIIFFGEELGWREYLQPKLQVLFGKKLGVIILGFIWGIWHLPLCFMLYSPSTPIYCVISHIFYCILLGIFLGFVYMKTRNIWSVIIIHLINNSMIINESSAYDTVITAKYLVLGLIFCAIVFLPFLFTKEYKGKMSEG